MARRPGFALSISILVQMALRLAWQRSCRIPIILWVLPFPVSDRIAYVLTSWLDEVLMAETKRDRPPTTVPSEWKLKDAKARFSEVVRRARSEGP